MYAVRAISATVRTGGYVPIVNLNDIPFLVPTCTISVYEAFLFFGYLFRLFPVQFFFKYILAFIRLG